MNGGSQRPNESFWLQTDFRIRYRGYEKMIVHPLTDGFVGAGMNVEDTINAHWFKEVSKLK